MNPEKIIDSIRLRLFWMKYGLVFLRSSSFQIKRIKIGQKAIQLSFPPGEENAMDYEFKNIFYDDCYGLRKIEGKVDSILDIGGNIGFFSMAARSRFPGARIHSYEPNPKIQSHLLSNTGKLSIEVHPEAIGIDEGWIDLKMEGGSLFSTAVASESGKIKKQAIAKAIDGIGGTVDLLKLDCEGAEWELFENQEIWKRINRLTMEYHLWANPKMDVPEMVRKIRDFGFRITHLCEEPKWGILHATKA
jgi:FkbM family methyltransferase